MATRITQAQLNKFISPEAAMAPYERAQQRAMRDLDGEQQMARQREQSDSRLSELIKGKQLEQDAIDSNVGRAREQAEKQGLQPNEYSITANQSGFGVNPEDKLGNWLKGMQIKNATEEKNDRAVERFADRQNKLNIAPRTADMLGVESATRGANGEGGMLTNPLYKPKTASRTLGYTPDFMKPAVIGIGEALNEKFPSLGFEKGTGKEAQALQSLMNTQIKSESGAAVNLHEQGRQDIANGTKSGDSEQIRRGVERMKRALEMDTQILEGSASGKVKSQYRAQGGEYDINRMLGTQPTTSPKPGDVYDGYVFLGGDPGTSANWRKN